MKTKLNQLDIILKRKGIPAHVGLLLKMYLAIVELGMRIPEVAQEFNIPEHKVQAALCFCGVELKRNRDFYNKLKGIYQDWKKMQQQVLFAV